QVWGARPALALYSLICSAATGVLAIGRGFPAIFGARMGIGLGQAGIFPCTTATLKHWFPPTQLAIASGWITTMMQVGAIVAAFLTGLLADPERLGWRWTFALFAAPGFIWSAWFYIWFRDRPADHPSVNAAELELLQNGSDELDSKAPGAPPERAPPVPWKQLLMSPALGFLCAAQMFRGAGYSFYSNWFTTYLREGLHVEGLAEAGFLTTLPVFATALGSIVGGWLSDFVLQRTNSRRLSRQWLSAASQFACALIVLAASQVSSAWVAVTIISAASFCAAIAGPIAYAVTIEGGGRHVPTVFGLMNMWGNIGAFAFPHAVAGLIGDASHADWNLVIFLFAGIYLASAVCWIAFNAERKIIDNGERGA
ncbi:MAG TPA: MFS transporter, partial [Planctomycetaceae bacterium]|nr:MFS transporter [Planctomycetaceae bacterium]